MSDSSVAGYLPPTAADAYDQALDRLLVPVVAGVTGLDPTLVRPRWQISAPTMPEPETNWAAVGVSFIDPDDNVYERHVKVDGLAGADASYSAVERDERMTMLTSFYGPMAASNAMKFFDGMQIEQNRAGLKSYGIDVVSVQSATRVPLLVAMKWQMRIDVSVELIRRTVRTYSILTIQASSSNGPSTLYVDGNQTTLTFDQNTSKSIRGDVYAAFLSSPDTGSVPLSVYFVDRSNGGPTNWLWDFGDGTTSDQQNPVHTYTTVGTFTVIMRAWRDGAFSQVTQNGCVSTASHAEFSVLLETGGRLLLESGGSILLE